MKIRFFWFIRFLKLLPISVVYYIVMLFKYITDKEVRKDYIRNKSVFYNINTIESLMYFIKIKAYNRIFQNFKFRHISSELEFIGEFGVSENIPYYIMKKLKEIGYECGVVYIAGKKGSGHLDCFFTKGNEQIGLFNYGYPLYEGSLDEAVKRLWINGYKKELVGYVRIK